jgi:hypothetical protein
MITDTELATYANTLGVAIMCLLVLYHYLHSAGERPGSN